MMKKISEFRADWLDVASLKIAVFFATLFLAKIWSPLLNLEWYWYVLGWVIFAVRPWKTTIKWFWTA
ncbi:MAG: hypothetical protein ACE5D7_04835 [Fidelibacterota bacterium]